MFFTKTTLIILQGFLLSTTCGLVPQNFKEQLEIVKSLQHLSEEQLAKNLKDLEYNKLSVAENISETCRQNYEELRVDLFRLETYAVQFADSEGKLPSGVLQGNFHSWGSYDQCTKAQRLDNVTQAVIFKGKYCRAIVGMLNIGKCFPDSCSDADIQNILIPDNTSSVTGVVCPSQPALDGSDIAVIVLCCVLALLLVIGTATDMIMTQQNKNSDKKPKQGLFLSGILSFSVISNLPKILSTETRSGNINCLNGMRVLCLFWVILGHIFSNFPVASDNILPMAKYAKNFDMQVLMNATISVDTFFFISGLLVCYLTLKQLEKGRGKLNWFLFYFHRFWRLTPVYMFTIMMVATLVHHMVQDGPITDYMVSVDRDCAKNWWTNLLYIQNFYPTILLQDVCVNWTWYLANDMQFYFISPVIIIALYRKPKIGMAIIFLFLVMCLLVRGIIAYEYDISPIFYSNVTNKMVSDHHYSRPYYRIAPFLTGLVLGYYLWYKKLKVNIPWSLAIVGWIAAIAINMSVLYGLWGYYYNENYEMDNALVVYETFHRWAWSLGVAWLTLACIANKAGWINTFLSWKGWLPLTRLSYAAYLIHIPIICLHTFSVHTPFHFDIYTLIYKFFADVVTTFMASLVVVLAIESPMLGIEKIILQIVTPPKEKKMKGSQNDMKPRNNSAKSSYHNDGQIAAKYDGVVDYEERNMENFLELKKSGFAHNNGAYLPSYEEREHNIVERF